MDMDCCSLPEADSLIDAGEVRALGVMAPKRAVGYEQIPTFAELGTDWDLGGWRAIAVPVGTPIAAQQKLQAALQKMVQGDTERAGTTFPQFMDQSGFDHTFRSGDELKSFLQTTDKKLGALITSDVMRSVNEDPFHPMTFPGILLGLLGLTLIAGMTKRLRSSPAQLTTAPSVPATESAAGTNYAAFAIVIVSILAYVLLAETVGFVLICFAILFSLSLWMGAKPLAALTLAVVFPLVIYQLFAHLLRVPLPQGWLGW
jgi:hypothetical protein